MKRIVFQVTVVLIVALLAGTVLAQGGSALWRMPASRYPTPTCPYKVHVVKLKGDHRSTPTSGLPDDQGAIFAPKKVLMPDLTAWVEKGYLLTALRVSAVCLRSLVAVAQRTSQP
jgi:hypothetical protein